MELMHLLAQTHCLHYTIKLYKSPTIIYLILLLSSNFHQYLFIQTNISIFQTSIKCPRSSHSIISSKLSMFLIINFDQSSPNARELSWGKKDWHAGWCCGGVRLGVQIKQELMENIINKINSKRMTQRTISKEFSIIKFEPGNILLLHKPSKKAFQYYEGQGQADPSAHLSHASLIRPIVYNNGLLYPKGLSTLEIQLENRKKAYTIVNYSQEQILNTFVPVLECIAYLHAQGQVHGAVCPSNILVTEDHQIKIKDWLVEEKENIYYFNKKRKEITKEDDLVALGQILTQAATLRKGSKIFIEKELNQVLQTLIDRYSKGLFFAISVLLKRNKERFPLVLSYLHNDERTLNDIELNGLYESIRRQKERKKVGVSNENLSNTNSLKPTLLSLNESPIKKGTPNSSLGSTIKRVKEDSENKRVYNEETKKKQIEKINKIIERSNDFVNELMARKNNDQILKKIAPKPNIGNLSLYSESHKKTIKDSPLITSPIKKIRTVSRKK